MRLSTTKWGFIGCGNVTENKSGPAFNIIENSQIVAVMCRNKNRAEKYARQRNIARWYDDALELIDDKEVNAVYIATPPSTHATYAIMALKAGKPVYIEKPMAANYEDCLRINRVSEETGIPCFVAYYRRYLPYFLKVKELIKENTIGKIGSIQIRLIRKAETEQPYTPDNLPWRLDPEIAGGGYFYDLAPHQIDILQDIFGYILEAQGYRNNVAGLYSAEDTVSASFQFENGISGTGSWSFAAHTSAEEDSIHIIGTNGTIKFSTFEFSPIEVYTDNGVETINPENPEHIQQPLIQAVVDDLRGIAPCSSTGESATATNWVLDRILGKL